MKGTHKNNIRTNYSKLEFQEKMDKVLHARVECHQIDNLQSGKGEHGEVLNFDMI